MNSRVVPASVISAAIVLSGCASTSPGRNVATDQPLQKMTSQGLRSALNGNTVEWPDGSAVYYDGSEIRTSGSDGSSIVGAISFNNDQHCLSWTGGGERCSAVYKGSDGKLSFFVEGEADSSSGYASIVRGNPNKL